MGSVTRSSRATSRAERREELSHRLLAAVGRGLDEASYTELSVDRLVREAGVSRSAFYLHFEDKSDLLRSLYGGVVDELLAAAETWWSLPPEATRPEIYEGFRILLDAYRPHWQIMRAVNEVASYDPEVGAEFEALMGRAVGEVSGHIRTGQAAGAIRADLDADAVASCLTWMTERVLMQVLGSADAHDAHRHLSSLVDVFWHTLYAGRERPD